MASSGQQHQLGWDSGTLLIGNDPQQRKIESSEAVDEFRTTGVPNCIPSAAACTPRKNRARQLECPVRLDGSTDFQWPARINRPATRGELLLFDIASRLDSVSERSRLRNVSSRMYSDSRTVSPLKFRNPVTIVALFGEQELFGAFQGFFDSMCLPGGTAE